MKGHVHHKLHLEDQGALWFTRGSISVNVEDDEMVQICLCDLAPRFNVVRIVTLARENPPSFFDLQSMLLIEENHVRTKNNASEGDILAGRLAEV